MASYQRCCARPHNRLRGLNARALGGIQVLLIIQELGSVIVQVIHQKFGRPAEPCISAPEVVKAIFMVFLSSIIGHFDFQRLI